MTRYLIVCKANICRSPMALSIALKLVHALGLTQQLLFDSAGTHAGGNQKPDPRAVAALVKKGYQPPLFRSRRVASKDFELFDAILAMDLANLEHLQKICPPHYLYKLHLLLDGDVPDPYYGPSAGFDHVLTLCERGITSWIQKVQLATPAVR